MSTIESIHLRITSGSVAFDTGVGMIEVLIALLILSVGMIGIVGMQISGKQTNNESVQRTTASHLAFDLMERMRANSTALHAYVTAGVVGGGAMSAPGATHACDKSAHACNPGELATYDLYQWERSLDGQSEVRGANDTGGLVRPRACIDGPAAGGNGMYTVVLVWRGTQDVNLAGSGQDLADFCGGALNTTGLYSNQAGAINRHRRLTKIAFFIAV